MTVGASRCIALELGLLMVLGAAGCGEEDDAPAFREGFLFGPATFCTITPRPPRPTRPGAG